MFRILMATTSESESDDGVRETALQSDSEGEEEGFDPLRVAGVAFVYRIPRFRNSKFRLLKLSLMIEYHWVCVLFSAIIPAL